MAFRNTFSWSYSRHGLFDQCLRKYWLNHYGFWGGWERGGDPRKRQLYIQKKLTTLPMWIGTVVHDTAEGALVAVAKGVTPWEDRAVELGLERANKDIADSREGRNNINPKRFCGFQDHYYGQDEPDWQPALDEIEKQIRTLFGHPVFRRMLQVPERIREIEVLRLIDIEGVPVYVKLDAMMEDGEGGLVVVDWKTGKDHADAEVAKQLGIYGNYAVQEHDADVEKLQALHVNLRYNTHTLHPVNPDTLAESRRFVRESADRMLSALTDPEENEGREEDFPMLPEGSAACARCRFRRDCDREG